MTARFLNIKKGFSLLELIIVCVIIGILASFALPAFRITKERALQKEAAANLNLIAAAEKIYKMESGFNGYGNCPDTTTCNAMLNLSVPLQNWDYYVDGAAASAFTAHADRAIASSSCNITMDRDGVKTVTSCP